MLKVYNSLTRTKEEIKKDEIKMYTCGPTVYYYPHIGNMRAYLFMDFLRRTIKYNGIKIEGVMNLTDVGHLTSDEDNGDDKMELAAKRENKDPYEISRFYTKCFMDNIKDLNIDIPEHIAKATDYVPEMIEMVKSLEEKGYTYSIDDGIYFDVTKFKDYGALSGKDMSKVGVNRIDENEQKHHPFDFALWKRVDPSHIMKWNSPWGVGCPGWHIECSTLGDHFLGDSIDIHTGGIDHLPIHHENEIAQSNCAKDKKVVDKWMHCEFLQVDGGKMGKSLGNCYTLDELKEKGFSPLDFRYLNLLTHYRKSLNFTFDAITSAKNTLKNLRAITEEHKNGTAEVSQEKISEYKQKFLDCINDDINIPGAVGVVWTMVKSEPKSKQIYAQILDFDKVLGLNLDKQEQTQEIPEEIKQIAEERWQARLNKNWAKSDELRNKLNSLGYNVLDSKENYQLTKF